MSASSAAFLSPPPTSFPHTPPSLSATPSFTLPVPHLDLASRDSTRDVSQSRCPPSRLRASSIDPDPHGEQSRITMQTRVAVRDTTPHRFQIIPLREHRLSYLPEGPNERQSEPKYRPHELIRTARSQHAALSQSLSCVSRPDENMPASASSAYSLRVPQTSSYKHESVLFPTSDTQIPTSVRVEKRASIPPSRPPLHQIKPENALLAPSSLYGHRNSCSVPATSSLSSEHPDLQKTYRRNVKSNVLVQDKINGPYIGSTTGKMKCRVCSEDLTRCGDRKCTHGYSCLRCSCADSSWHTTITVTRRHAIYTDALLLPVISRDSSSRRMWRAPVAHNHEANHLSLNHHVGSRISQGASIQTLDKGLRVVPGVVYSSLPGNVDHAVRQTNTPAEFGLPPVSRLRLSKKTRDSSTSRASFTHEDFARHSNTILELITLLDLAIRDWKEIGRDQAVLRTSVHAQGSRL